MRTFLLLACLLGLRLPALAEQSALGFDVGEGRVAIKAGPQLVATYVWDDPITTRPYFANICAPDGTPVTRTHPPDPVLDKDNDDHATFHPGIWLAFGDIGGSDTWRLKARIRHERFLTPPTLSPLGGSFSVFNRYESLEVPPKILAEEECQYLIVVDGDGFFLVSRSVFRPVGQTLVFGDQEEMGFGVRLATGLSVKRGGTIVSSDGGVNEAGTWGKAARWCAAFGSTGGKTAGVVLMPGPENFRASWFHSRDYGLMVANPFGKKAMNAPDDKRVSPDATQVEVGKALRLDFGVYVFSGAGTNPPNAAEKYQRYVALLDAGKE